MNNYIVGNGNTHRFHYFMSSYQCVLCLIFRHFHTIHTQRKEDACFLFSQVQPFKQDFTHLFCTGTVNAESKRDYHWETEHIGMVTVL